MKKENDDVSKHPDDDSISSGSVKEEEKGLQSSHPKQISSATLGAEFARVLLSELRLEDLPEPTRHNKIAWIKELHDEVPKRGSIVNFRRMGKQKQHAAKWVFSAQIASERSDVACKRLFCIIHSEFVPAGCMASEHAYPYAKVQVNQKHLLNFLNTSEDKEMINSFLNYPNIKEYLRRDGGRIKGSTYFYKQCYNIMDNLFLMCQGCNSSKSDSDPLEWFKEKENAIYFGDPFIKHIEKQGGLHEGILLPRVYKKKAL